MLDPNDPVSITLAAHEWNVVLGILGDAPFRVAAPLINKMAEQTRTQGQEVAPRLGSVGTPHLKAS